MDESHPRTGRRTSGAPRRRAEASGPRSTAGRALALVPALPRTGSVPLAAVTASPLPEGACGALVTSVGPRPDRRLHVCWIPERAGLRLPPGRVLLAWTRTADGRSDVTARLGLAGAEVRLATWPALAGEWSTVVTPTVAEVMAMHAALSLVTSLLDGPAPGSRPGVAGGAGRAPAPPAPPGAFARGPLRLVQARAWPPSSPRTGRW